MAGEPMLRDIISELEKQVEIPALSLSSTPPKRGNQGNNRPQVELEGIVTNVANFGSVL